MKLKNMKTFEQHTDKERLERLIVDEYDTIKKLKEKKREIDRQIDNYIVNVDKYREMLNAL